MKYFRIFKAKKPIGQLSEAERREFANNMASNILENIISVETRSKAQDLRDVEPSNFVNTRDDFIRTCKTRDDLKKNEKETLDKEEVAEIFKKLKRRANRPAWTGSNKRKPSKKGPVKAPVRLVKPEDTKASLEHPTDSVKSGESVANEVKKPKK